MKIDSYVNVTSNLNVNNRSDDMVAPNQDSVKIQSNDVVMNKDFFKEVEQDFGMEPRDDLIGKSIEQANKRLADANKYIERNIHDVTKTVIYKLVDADTKEIIKEFPPEKIQDMIAKMWELAGLFVDERA